MKKIEVVAAIIIHEDKILCMKRGKGKFNYLDFKFEFPGGKIEPGENPEEALIRELEEEIDIEIKISEDDFFMTVTHEYPDFNITMHSYKCYVNNSKFNMKEHVDYKWSKINDLPFLDWAEADIPIVEKIIKEG